MKSFSGREQLIKIDQIKCFEPIKRKDPKTRKIEASGTYIDQVHHPNLILRTNECIGADEASRIKAGQASLRVPGNDILCLLFSRWFIYENFVIRGLIDRMEPEK